MTHPSAAGLPKFFQGRLLRTHWNSPWLTMLREKGEAVQSRWSCDGVLSNALNGVRASTAVCFVAEAKLPIGEAYEAFVYRTQTIPTRDNLHDFFNGLVWLHLPASKRRLNALQAGEIERAGVGATRGPLRDALTLFDENGAVLDAPPALWEALVARDWQRLFVGERALWNHARLLVFGHALLEKLAVPRKATTAHVLCTPPLQVGLPAATDAALAAALDPAWLATKPFCPLPVLGIPGWSPENENFSFYDDSDVFRPRRHPRTTDNSPVPRPDPA